MTPRTDVEAALDAAFDRALEPWRGEGEPYTVLFSGGVDSALLAWELRGTPRARALTVGRSGAKDLRAAEDLHANLPVPWTGVLLEEESLRDLYHRLEPLLAPLGPTALAYQFGLAAAVGHASTRAVLCGQGADELFLGYAHFQGLGLEEARERARADLARALDVDLPAAQGLAHRLDRELVAPYLDPGFVDAALRVPLEARLPNPTPKHWFRTWAVGRGLPEPLAVRPKKALQYGTGVDAWLAGRTPSLPR